MAEKYFKHFPTIDFDVKNDGNLIEAKDVFRNIRVFDDADEANRKRENDLAGLSQRDVM